MTKDENRFDAVGMMRTIRNELDERMRGMTFDERQAYIRKHLRSASTGPDVDAVVTSPLPRGGGPEGGDPS